MKNTLFAAALVSAATLAAVSGARADNDRQCGNVPLDRWMGEQKIREKASAAGLEVGTVRIDEGCYEVDGRTRDGQRVDVHFNPETGEQVSIDSNDNGNDNDGGNDNDNNNN